MESICLLPPLSPLRFLLSAFRRLPSADCRLPTAFERSSGLRRPLHSRSCECGVFALDTRLEMW